MNRRRNRRREEQRRRLLIVSGKILLVFLAFALTAYYAYEVGIRVTQRDETALQDKLARADDAIRQTAEDLDAARAAADEAAKQARSFKDLYDQVKPTDEMRELDAAIKEKIKQGMDPRHLALLVRQASTPHGCLSMAARRFFVRTPLFRGPLQSTTIRFDDDVSLTADGNGAEGGRDQWFDPAQPVHLHILAGEKKSELSGQLPLEEILAMKSGEYHLVFAAGAARGWIEVTGEHCETR